MSPFGIDPQQIAQVVADIAAIKQKQLDIEAKIDKILALVGPSDPTNKPGN